MNAKCLLMFLCGIVALLSATGGESATQLNSTGWSEQQMYVIGSCVEVCFARGHSTRAGIDNCLVFCLKESLGQFSHAENAETFIYVDLVCRDSESLRVKMVSTEEMDTNLYLIRVEESDNSSIVSKILTSRSGLVTLDGLRPNTRYNVTAVTLNANHHFIYTSVQRQFETLPEDYYPGPVIAVNLSNFSSSQENDDLLDAVVFWEPSTDRTCHFEILYHSTDETRDDHLSVHRAKRLLQLPVKALEFDSEYAVAVQAINPAYSRHNSAFQWYKFHTPSCSDWRRGSAHLCAPAAVTNITVAAAHLADDNYRFNVSWAKPTLIPDSYVLKLYDLNPAADEKLASPGSWHVNGNATSVIIESFPIHSLEYGVFITAHANNRSSLNGVILPTYRLADANRVRPLAIVTLIVVFTLACLIKLAIRMIRQRKSRANRLELLCKYVKDPENPSFAGAEVNTKQQTIVKIRSEMEVMPHQVQLQKVLGEGAFGMVRKGILTRSQSGAIEVAVKTLKDYPSSEEIKEFRREIEVMVSVGSHPNVVSIVGYCTGSDIELMLLTEYCSEGNLLNYLKAEWERLSQDCSEPRTPCAYGNKQPEDMFNFNTSFVDDKSLCRSNAFSNKLYQITGADVNGNLVLDEFKNKLDSDQQRPRMVENIYEVAIRSEKDGYSVEVMEASARLVDFSRQIATGMNFLARNKVVHRDLAARNVLISGDNIVKISDFGLSRDIYQDNMYRKVGNGKLPIKWLALESLTHQIYTSQSDVWSFGILLYEICTLGATPYPLLSSGDLIVQLRQGFRMEQPAGCSGELYDLMMACWCAHPLDRPTFCSIQNRLEGLVEKSADRRKPLIDLTAIAESTLPTTPYSPEY